MCDSIINFKISNKNIVIKIFTNNPNRKMKNKSKVEDSIID